MTSKRSQRVLQQQQGWRVWLGLSEYDSSAKGSLLKQHGAPGHRPHTTDAPLISKMRGVELIRERATYWALLFIYYVHHNIVRWCDAVYTSLELYKRDSISPL